MRNILSESKHFLLHCLFPPLCVGCGQALFGEQAEGLCASCANSIPWVGAGACRFCGMPAGEYAVLGKGCEACRRGTLHFTRATAVMRFRNPARDLLHAFKFTGQRQLALPLAQLLQIRLQEVEFPKTFSCVIPVPLHLRRQRERGYNQSALLAQALGARLSLPVRENVLRRVRNTPAQTALSRAARLRNLENAFAASPLSGGETVLLVDDVMTTGATVSECARMLRDAGAARVYVIVAARSGT